MLRRRPVARAAVTTAVVVGTAARTENRVDRRQDRRGPLTAAGLIQPRSPKTHDAEPRRMTVLAYDYPLLGIFWTHALVLPLDRLDRAAVPGVRRHLPQPRHGRLGQGAVVDLRDLRAVPRRVHLPDRPGRPDGASTTIADAQAQDAGVPAVRPGRRRQRPSTADELAKLADLKDQGVITDAEFQQQKAKILV